MSPCSLGKDFWAVTSFLLQWNPRQRVSPADCLSQGLPSSGWHWGDGDCCGDMLSTNGTWAQLRNRNHCGRGDLNRTELWAPEGRRALSRIFPARKLSREMHRAFLISCCHLPSAAHRLLLLLCGGCSALGIELQQRLTNQLRHKQLISNNFAD